VEDLAKFFADIIEFIVGGVLFVASLLLVLHAVSTRTLEALSDGLASTPSGLDAGYTVAALAMVYAMGIVAEGVSRAIFEPRLTKRTGKAFPGADDAVGERERLRLSVKHQSEKLDGAVNAQLKRLRIERTLALSSAIATVAFLIEPRWWFLFFLGLTVVAMWLVEERFRRYVATIKDAYRALAFAAEEAEG